MKTELKRIAIWDITSRCNLRCAHCYNQERYWDNAEKYNELSIEEIKIILNKLRELSFTRVHLLGGEPLMAHNLEFLISYARKLKLEVTMVTNGTLMDSAIFIKLCNLGVKSVSISLDGTTAQENDQIRGKGAFERATINIKNADKIRKEINSDILLILSFTLTRKNYNNSHNLLSFAENLGIDSVNVSYLSNEGAARKDFEDLDISQLEKFEFIDKVISDHKKHRRIGLHIDARSWLAEYIYKKHGEELVTDELGCKGGNKQFYILADGKILPCSPAGTSMGKWFDERIPGEEYPNLISDSVETIVNSPKHICFYQFTRSKDTYVNIYPCNKCKYTCTACPLLYRNNHMVEECLIAQKKVEELDMRLMEQKFKIRENLRISTQEDKVEILDFVTQNVYILDGISLFIWNKLDGNRSVKELVKEIAYEFQCESEKFYSDIEQDIREYIYKLKSLELIY